MALLALGGCAVMGGEADAARDSRPNWLVFGAEVERASALELDAMRSSAREAHAVNGSADSAIRLAILEASSGNAMPDFALAVQLLDDAIGAEDVDSADLDFVGFFRPWVVSLQEHRAALDAATAETQSLRQQLNALRALEVQLDADD